MSLESAALAPHAPIELRSPTRETVGSDAPETERTRIQRSATTPAAKDTEAAAISGVSARGRVMDLKGRGIAGIQVNYLPNFGTSVRATTDADGWFELPAPVTRGIVHSISKELHCLSPGILEGVPDVGTPIVLVCDTVQARGRVVDEKGTALRGALELVLPKGWDSALSIARDSSLRPRCIGQFDGEGLFSMEVPDIEGARLEVNAGPDYVKQEVALSDLLGTDHKIVLEAIPQPASILIGRVVDQDDKPVAGASICLERREAVSDEQGRFEINTEKLRPGHMLCALKSGHLPVMLADPAGSDASAHGWTDEVLLRIPGTSLAITGTVVDSKGKPKKNVSVLLAEQTPIGLVGGTQTWAENFLGEGLTQRWADDAAAFHLKGLLDRDYDLVIIDDQTLWTMRVDGVPAGARDLEIVFEKPTELRDLTGRCVTPDGEPLAGVQLHAGIEPVLLRFPGVPGPGSGSRFGGHPVTTDEDGFFEMKELPAGVEWISISGSKLMPGEYELAGDWHESEHEIIVDRRSPFEIEVTGEHADAQYYELLDENGESLVIYEFSGYSSSSSTMRRLEAGKSGLRTVSERARELVLRKGALILDRSPVSLKPGKLVRLRVR